MISERFEFDRTEALSYALEIVSVPEDESVLFEAADYMEEHGLTAFDAYPVAYAGDDTIVSSDTSFDESLTTASRPTNLGNDDALTR